LPFFAHCHNITMLFHFVTLFMLLGSASALGPERVQLGSAEDFAVLSKAGIKASPPGTLIDGNMGSSPIAMTGNTGWGVQPDDTSTYPPYTTYGASKVTSAHKMYGPSPYMTSGIEDMMIAHTDAMSRTSPDFTNFSGYTYTPGLYLWTSDLVIPTYTDLIFKGGPDDVWIMKITTAFTLNSYSRILLDGARAENIFWAMGTAATIGTYAHTEGTFLAGSAITLAAYSTFHGAHMAQTAVTLDHVNGLKKTANYPEPTCEDSYPDYDSKLEPVDLNYAANFAILSKSGVTTTDGSKVIGDMGSSPIAYTGMTGFDLVMDNEGSPAGTFSTSYMVTGEVFGANHAAPTPAWLTESVDNMMAAYTDAQGRPNPDEVELNGGDLDRMTLVPGLYKWSTDVYISSGLTFIGDADDIWIMQIAGNVIVGGDADIVLCGGAQAVNIFWAVAGLVDIGVWAHIEGIWLVATKMVFRVGSSLDGSALAQTAVTLDNATVILANREVASAEPAAAAAAEEEYLCE
jgi:hypothetical protein